MGSPSGAGKREAGFEYRLQDLLDRLRETGVPPGRIALVGKIAAHREFHLHRVDATSPRHNQGKHLIVAQRQSNLKLSDNQKSGKKILANYDNRNDHDFATGHRFKLRLPPFSSRLSRNTSQRVA
jgi:hypothetical protein